MVDDRESGSRVVKCYFLEHFKEVSEILQIIRDTANASRDLILTERSLERFTYIIDQYQEQPHLLDANLKSILDELLQIIKSNKTDKPVVHLASKFLYILTKTRGYKVIACILPHEVSDLHPLLLLLADEDHNNSEAFECKYILLLWLSIVCIVPFHLSRFDDTSDKSKQTTSDKIYYHGQRFLGLSNRCQEVAAFMLSRFLSRPDVGPSKLKEFIDWGLSNLSSDFCENKTAILITGVLLSFASLLKYGQRKEVATHAKEIFERIEASNLHLSNNVTIRKLSIKVIQRIGLTFLKPKLASWRYKRGLRSLSQNLKMSGSGDHEGFEGEVVDADEIDDMPDVIEQVIEKLLNGLRDKDVTIRWSSAKGIGRITGRLPLSLIDEVVASVLELFTPSETEDAWHGGCLCLGELGHRGLLLPDRLSEVVPHVARSLEYDERRGTCSVGGNVRDSAAFVCWSFARAYDEDALLPFIQQLVQSLVVTCLFDREVKVRRAASAALQELVGRQGNVVHGIDVITTCDYYAVGNRNNCYLQLSLQVAEYTEFRQPIIDHLMKHKISHWDVAIREFAGEALGLLSHKSGEFFIESGLKYLVASCTCNDFPTRHGSLLCLAHILFALTTRVDYLLESDAISGLLTSMMERKYFRGTHGDMMRKAFCFFIRKMCQAKFRPTSLTLIDDWMGFLLKCLHNPDETVQNSALEAASSLLEKYCSENIETINNLMKGCWIELNNDNSHVRCSYCLFIGSLPLCMLSCGDNLKEVISSLFQHALYFPYLKTHPSNILANVTPPRNPSTVEERRDAVQALAKLCCKVGLDGGICCEDIKMVYEVLFVSMNDYTLDDRGDVGTSVRESCMMALYDITCLSMKDYPDILTNEICQQIFCFLIQQASEKIDRTRSTAGEVFSKLLYHIPEIKNIPRAKCLKSIFPEDEVAMINWASPSETFPKFVKLMTIHEYSYSLILGTIISTGGLTESLVKYSATSLMDHLDTLVPDQVFDFWKILIRIFRDHLKVDRITLPLLKTLGMLLTNECFSSLLPDQMDEIVAELSAVCIDEVNKSGDVKKLMASVDVFCILIQTLSAVRGLCLSQLMMFLCHRFPIIRKSCAARLYESLISCELVEDSHHEEISTILIETDWDLPVEQLRPIRNNLCSILGISAPVLVKKTK